jgi:hypothetical protein
LGNIFPKIFGETTSFRKMLAENEFSIEEEEVDEETEEKVRETLSLFYFIVFFPKLILAYSQRFDDQFFILKLF